MAKMYSSSSLTNDVTYPVARSPLPVFPSFSSLFEVPFLSIKYRNGIIFLP